MESHQWISNVWCIKSTCPLTTAPTTDVSAQFLLCPHSLGTWKQFLHRGSIVAGSSAATHRQERTQFAPLGSALLHLGGCSVYSYATATVCFKAGTKAHFPEQLYDTAHHPERHVAFYPNGWLENSHDDRPHSSLHRRDKGELQCPRYVLERGRSGALDERGEPRPGQEGGRGCREHQSGGLAHHHHCRVRRARQTGPASRHGDEAGRAAGVGRLAAHGHLPGACPLGQHCLEAAAAVAVPRPRQRRRLVQAGSQPGQHDGARLGAGEEALGVRHGGRAVPARKGRRGG